MDFVLPIRLPLQPLRMLKKKKQLVSIFCIRTPIKMKFFEKTKKIALTQETQHYDFQKKITIALSKN